MGFVLVLAARFEPVPGQNELKCFVTLGLKVGGIFSKNARRPWFRPAKQMCGGALFSKYVDMSSSFLCKFSEIANIPPVNLEELT